MDHQTPSTKTTGLERVAAITKFFQRFAHSQQFSGFLLLGCTMFSLGLANSDFGLHYLHLWHINVGVVIESWKPVRPVEFFINDGLMAIFFLLVGLEIKREILMGELSGFKRASLPIAAALGGMIFPAAIFMIINSGSRYYSGWGIPMATDIAFALGILSLLGNRVPASLKVFLAALAVADDLGAIIVIGVFYTKQLAISHLLYAVGVFSFLMVLNKLNVRSLLPYAIGGILLWLFIYKSGVHATISGVLLALAIPSKPSEEGESLLHKLEELLHDPVNFIIMPLFALANTGIIITESIGATLEGPLPWGIILGLVLGKPIGIFLCSWVVVRARLSQLPEGVNWPMLAATGMLGGIGFTMSIFISLLAFTDVSVINHSKIAVLIASAIAASLGLLSLYLISYNRDKKLKSAKVMRSTIDTRSKE
jgi:Na+:H+ antiporter, NhaA family